MKKFTSRFVLLIAFLWVIPSTAEEKAVAHSGITDPKIYIPLREEMTHMEIKFVELEMLAATKPLDYAAIEASLQTMTESSKKIRSVNQSEVLKEPLKNLTEQLTLLKKDVRGRDAETIKNHLDRLYQTCFRCHETHVPKM